VPTGVSSMALKKVGSLLMSKLVYYVREKNCSNRKKEATFPFRRAQPLQAVTIII
jgi:hypothetical protein